MQGLAGRGPLRLQGSLSATVLSEQKAISIKHARERILIDFLLWLAQLDVIVLSLQGWVMEIIV
jgi:hypothetical protein